MTMTRDIPIQTLDTVVIRFAGDSGDGMQVTGAQFTNTSAVLGNDVHTFPDFPAEIRAPQGTLPGVSGFQISFSNQDIRTAGDRLDALVAFNPAALKANLSELEEGGLLIVNSDSFTEKELKKATFESNPLEDDSLSPYRLFPLPISSLNLNALGETTLSHSAQKKCKNMFALGIIYWLYDRGIENTISWLTKKFNEHPEVRDANVASLKAGYNYALTTEIFTERYTVRKASLSPGTYRQITGNQALALGCVAASTQAKTPLLFAGYPITPASSILQELSRYQHFGVTTFQAEDEIASICAAMGASFGGHLAVTATSGPGFDLKMEGLGLAVMTELPLVLIDVQRAGPSTGMPTKSEQADLLMAMYGRHGECPIPILSPSSPSDCFNIVLKAFQIAIKYMTPVIILSDGHLANAAEPWKLPEIKTLPTLQLEHNTLSRNSETLAKPWVIPGMKDREFRLGGIEKDFETSDISYDPDNHEAMVKLRSEKVLRIANDYESLDLIGPESGELLILSWGSTYGAILSAVERLHETGLNVSHCHLRYINPFHKDLGKLLKQFNKVLIPELNSGQLAKLIRAEYLIDSISFNKITGKPFLISEIEHKIRNLL